jgi:translocation and assembly module TamB
LTSRAHPRLARLARHLRRVVAGVAIAVVALCAAVDLGLDTGWGRALVVREVNAALRGTFKGSLVIDRLGSVHLGRASGIDARVVAPDGTVVIAARGASARVAPVELLLSLIRGGDLRIDIFDADVASVDVDVAPAADGTPLIASAFEPARPSEPGAKPGRGVRLTIPGARMGHSVVRHALPGWPDAEATLDDLRASVNVVPGKVTVDVSRASMAGRQMPAQADPHGVVEAHLVVPAQSGSAFELKAAFRGDVGGVATRAEGTVDEAALDALAEVPEARPEAMRALVEAWPLRRPVFARVEAHGPWSAVQVTARATEGPAQVDAKGEVSLRGSFAASMTVDARDVDLAAVSEGLPRSDLGLHATASVKERAHGDLAGHFTMRTPAGTLAAANLPPVVLAGDFTSSPPRVTFEGSTRVARLESIDPGAGALAGAAEVHVTGTLALARTARLDAALEASVDHLVAGPASLDRARLAGRVTGDPSNPALSAVIDGQGLRVGRRAFTAAHLEAQGRLLEQEVDVSLVGATNVRAHAKVALGSAVDVDGITLTLSRGSRQLRADVDRVRVAGAHVDVEGALVTGAGEETRATLHVGPDSVAARAESRGLDLQALGYVLGIDHTLREGRVTFAVDVDAHRSGATGTASIDVSNGCFMSVDGLTGHLDARLAGREVTGALDAGATGIGDVKMSSPGLHVGGTGALDLRGWRRIWGELQVDGTLDLTRLAALLPPNTLPLADVAGRVHVHGHMKRDGESDVVPDLSLSIQTWGLRLGGRGQRDRPSDGTVLVAPRPWTLEGVDVAMDASVAGGGLTELALRLGDARGAAVVVDAKSDAVPYAQLFASGAGLVDALERVPFKAQVSIPERSLESLPDVLRPAGVAGSGQATLAFEGTCRAPSVELRGTVRWLRLLDARGREPLDADFSLTYDGHEADGEAGVRSAAQTLLHATAQVHADAPSMLGGAPAWDASMQALLTRLPFGIVPFLSDRGLRGEASGHVELTGLHRDARAAAEVDLSDLRVGKQSYGSVHVKGGFDGQVVVARADFSEGDGSGSLAARAGVVWGERVVPAFDPTQPAEVSLRASRLRLGVLGPFVQGAVENLDGRLDADARVALAPGREAELGGSATLSEGQVALAPLGQELRAVRGKVTFEPGGIVRLTDLSASGISGRLGGSAVAHLAGTRLVDAEAQVRIAKKEAMPLSIEGTEVGTVYGEVDAKTTTSADGRTTNVSLDVPSLHVELPEAMSHSVQELGAPPEGVHVGVYMGPGRFVELAVDGSRATGASDRGADGGAPLVAEMHLGNDVSIQRGTDLKVDLGGTVTAKTGKETTVTGEIHLQRGTLDVQGKTFDIQSGTVTFVGDPSNPLVRVTAAWPAPDGTRVFADYLGPLKTGKVTLRSEPPRPKNEILALVLFGVADGSASTPYATPQPDAATKAGTTVGGFATGGLSKGLDKLTGMDVTAKIDSSQANPRPEVEVQIARDISLQLAFVLGTPPPGTNPDTTYATIDWRFLRSWSLETTFGNLGSSIADLVWQHRY